MKPEVWRSLRWVVAFGACALVVVVGVPMAINAVTSSIVVGGDADDVEEADGSSAEEGAPASDEEPPAGGVPTGPVTDGEAEPDADLGVRDGTVQQASARALSLTDDSDVLVLLFPLIEGDPGCVASAALELSLLEADRTEVAVYAGDVEEGVDDGDEVGDPRRDDTVHALALTDGTPGRLRWDVTDLYRSWASGQLASPGAPFAVVVAVHGAPADVTFASSESDEADAPALVWAGEPGCGGSA